jgi:hypothetical protein
MNQPCPGNCPLWVPGGIAHTNPRFTVRWMPQLRKWHVHFSHKMTAVVTCIPIPRRRARAPARRRRRG